jgi:hypothetical protein
MQKIRSKPAFKNMANLGESKFRSNFMMPFCFYFGEFFGFLLTMMYFLGTILECLVTFDECVREMFLLLDIDDGCFVKPPELVPHETKMRTDTTRTMKRNKIL